MKDKIVQYPHRYTLTNVSNGQVLGTYDMAKVEGTVTEVGTPINKASLLTDEVASYYGLPNTATPNDVLNSRIKYYGKYSQVSGGDAKSGSAQNGVLTFTTEDNDDFNAINLVTSSSKINIVNGISLVKFYWSGNIYSFYNSNYGSASIKVHLRKNGTNIQTMRYVSSTYANCAISEQGLFYSTPTSCISGDYFEIYIEMITSSTYGSSSISAGSIFGMEVLK